MTRVAHFLHRIPPEYSGAGLQALALVRELERLRPGAQCLVAYAERPRAAHPPAGTPCAVVRLRSGPAKLLQAAQLFAALYRTRARVLHVHGYHRPAVLFGWLLRMKVVLKTTMVGVDDAASVRARGALDRFVLSKVTRVISLTAQLSASNRPFAPEVLIPNGVDVTRFSPCPPDPRTRAAAGIAPDATLFLYTGGDYERKGFDQLPELWASVRRRLGDLSPHLVVAGDFHRAGSAAWLRERLPGVDVTVVGELIEDVRPWLAATDVFLFPSTREGLPNAVLEAVAMDTFVLARHLSGTYEGVLDETNALLFDELNDATLDRLNEILLRGAQREIDNSAFRAVFDITRIGRAYDDLYRSLSA